MSTDERDTKFLGFAKLLAQDLFSAGFDEHGYRSPEATHKLIAQRAYDLLDHASCYALMNPALLDMTFEDMVREIPDISAWPRPE